MSELIQTRIFYKNEQVVEGQIKLVERELEFVKWTPRYLVVKYPPTSIKAGELWKMGRKLVNYWLKEKRLRIEGDIPEWALVI